MGCRGELLQIEGDSNDKTPDGAGLRAAEREEEVEILGPRTGRPLLSRDDGGSRELGVRLPASGGGTRRRA